MLGGFRNVEGVDLRVRGKDPVVTPVDQLGVPTYDELVLVANRAGSKTTRSRSASSSPPSRAAPRPRSRARAATDAR